MNVGTSAKSKLICALGVFNAKPNWSGPTPARWDDL
jgi:hypothetical protein